MSDIHELAVERLIDGAVGAVWRAYTDHLGEWFCPRPWRAEVVAMDLRAGGRSALTMYGPNGEVMPNEGVYLEVVPHEKIVFTDAFRAGWIPQGPFMGGFMEFARQGDRMRGLAPPVCGSARLLARSALRADSTSPARREAGGRP